jgi:ketosteroid isomerase-like protein
MTAAGGWLEADVYRGHRGLKEFWASWFAPFEEITFEVESVEPVGDAVVSVATQRGRGAAGGAPVEMRLAYVTEIRDGKAVSMRVFMDVDDAFRAAREGD